MTPRERFLAALRGQTPDRVPIHFPGFEIRSREDLSAMDDPLRRRVAERLYELMHFEVTSPSRLNRYLITPPQRMRHEAATLPNGQIQRVCTIDAPRGELTAVTRWDPRVRTSWTVKYPVETMDDIETIRSIPWERPPQLKPAEPAEAPAEFPRRGVHRISISSPMVCVAGMMPYEMFLELCAVELPLIKELTQICLERTLDALSVLLSPSLDVVWMGGSEWITPPMGSPRLYDELVQEQEREIIRFVHERSRALVHVHCHGRVRHALARAVERGADYTEPVEPPPDGDITMAEAKRVAAGHLALGGNLECRILYNESEDAAEAAARAAFEGGKERFVFRTTEGPSPRLSEREFRNYMRAVDVWEELSPI